MLSSSRCTCGCSGSCRTCRSRSAAALVATVAVGLGIAVVRAALGGAEEQQGALHGVEKEKSWSLGRDNQGAQSALKALPACRTSAAVSAQRALSLSLYMPRYPKQALLDS